MEDAAGEEDKRRLLRSVTGHGPKGAGWLTGQPEHNAERHPGAQGPPFALAILAGGCASASVDVLIYPLDTLKTRLQSPQGLHAAGGYRSLFRGVFAAGVGAIPGGAAFFGAYEYSRLALQESASAQPPWILDATAACIGAIASCVVRNPALVVQQRLQVGDYLGLWSAIRGVGQEGGFYNGLRVSIAREIPFAFIQFPIYEALKRVWVRRNGHDGLTPAQGALCGSVAGSLAAAATTPLDLLKTRQMLGYAKGGVLEEVRSIIKTDGVNGLFRGLGPRVGWMALGGYIFFGVYARPSLLTSLGTPAPHRPW